MPFTKKYARDVKGSPYPKWEEIALSDDEELLIDDAAKKENIKLMKQCIDDAKEIIKERGLKPYQTDLINIAIALFEKRASHSIYWKESKAKEKFDKKFSGK